MLRAEAVARAVVTVVTTVTIKKAQIFGATAIVY